MNKLTRRQLEELVRAVQEEHLARGTLAQTVPVELRGPRRRRRPRTEIIAEAAARKIAHRQAIARFLAAPRVRPHDTSEAL